MVCEKCGAQLDEDCVFCPKCGNKINAKKKMLKRLYMLRRYESKL